MQDEWFQELEKFSQNNAVIVPTRSLANDLNERVARDLLAKGKSVWVAPNILVWADYLRQLWQLNRTQIAEQLDVYSLISAQQSALLWTQVIEASRRSENELTLLNVQQTTRAAQRSWKLMHDWCLSAAELEQDHVADTEQFIMWAESYQLLLSKRGLIDEQMLMSTLLESSNVQHPFNKLHLISYDLLTAAQQKYLFQAERVGMVWRESRPSIAPESTSYRRFENSSVEISAALNHARACLEKDPEHTVTVVIPDLAFRQAQVQELARDCLLSC